jgi:NAD-dependent DNA ligase
MVNILDAPPYIQAFAGITLPHARDVILFHRFNYYVKAMPVISDQQYDHIEWFFNYLFPNDPVIGSVGSSNIADYPAHVVDGRRPMSHEKPRSN